MRAVQVDHHGGSEVLSVVDRERPEPASTEVLVKVRAAAVNPVDCKTRRGEGVARWAGPPPYVPGWDVAGVVVGTGYGVTRFAIGDAVFGMPRFPRAAGCQAEYATAPSRQLARSPDGLEPVEAGALPLAALTAWQALVDVAAVSPGRRVLVTAAAGGVGHLAVQIAKGLGAHVVASARVQSHSLLRALGADELVDSETGSGLDAPVDVALDLIGGDGTRAALGTIAPGGWLVAIAEGASADVQRLARKRDVEVSEPLVEPDGHALERVAELVGAGRLRPVLDSVFPLDAVRDAYERVESRHVRGKVVLEPAR